MSIVKIRAALELALDAMVGIIASVVIDTSVNGVFTTSEPHGLVSGLQITISDHSVIELNGDFVVKVLTATSFSLLGPVTQTPIVSTASGTGGAVKANLTAWDGVTFKPLPGIPYQRVNILTASPENPSYGGDFKRELGFMQVSLFYPKGFGTYDIATRAELIQSNFKRGSTVSFGGVTVNVMRTPEIQPLVITDEYMLMAVRIPYWSDIFG